LALALSEIADELASLARWTTPHRFATVVEGIATARSQPGTILARFERICQRPILTIRKDLNYPATEQPRKRAVRVGYAAPCCWAAEHEQHGHRHECIAGQGHTGPHRCYCGERFESGDATG
jgi:hypothetical protein